MWILGGRGPWSFYMMKIHDVKVLNNIEFVIKVKYILSP